MILVKESKSNQEVYFECQILEGSKVITTNQIYYRSIIRELDEFTYLMLYDTEMQPISEVFSFLNNYLSNQSLNTRIKALQALKLLYCYQHIIQIEFKDFTSFNTTNLKNFLRGISPKGQIISFDLQTIRSNDTINGYLSICRKFFEYLGIENKYLNKKNKVKDLNLGYLDASFGVERYVINEKIATKKVEVPAYISVSELSDIINEVQNNYGMREECIIRLMFESGMRIGEVLGLTADDIVMENIEGIYAPVIYIRNRFTDKRHQHAKTCMKIKNRRQYRTREYNTKGKGYQKVVISLELYELINEYIEEAHIRARDKKANYYYKYTVCDRVDTSNRYMEDINYYVFLNEWGKPVSTDNWNPILRKIFNAVGIQVDKGSRKNNLNHRFRHGYAMYNVQYLGKGQVELMDLMRHTSLVSVARYYKPTVSDQIQIKTEFANHLYEMIPGLKLGR